MIERALYFSLAAALLSGAFALVETRFGPSFHQWLRQRHARRLQARLARGSDRYFEELRSIQSAAPAAYVAHGFAWHFVRTFALMLAIFALNCLFDFLSQF